MTIACLLPYFTKLYCLTCNQWQQQIVLHCQMQLLAAPDLADLAAVMRLTALQCRACQCYIYAHQMLYISILARQH